MKNKFNFAQKFRRKLTISVRSLTKKLTDKLEKEMLEEHGLLVKATTVPYIKRAGISGLLAIVVGTAQGMDNAHRAYTLSKEIKKRNKKTKILFITSAAIGVSLNVLDKLRVPGVNAYVLSEMLRQYGVPEAQIITEGWSKNANEQAIELSWLAGKHKFKDVILVVDTWHGPRFYMSMLKHNPKLNFYTEYVDRDTDNINSAIYDWGQTDFQAPLFIGEIARIHTYSDRGTGGVRTEELINYLHEKQSKKSLPKSITPAEFIKLKSLWKKNHLEIVKNFDKLASYR